MSYTGGENATPDKVRQYLAENFAYADGGELSGEDLDTLMTKYDDIVQDGVRAGSFASVPPTATGAAYRAAGRREMGKK